MHMTVDEGIEYKLRIPTVVAYLSLIGEPVAFLREVQMDGVDAGAVVIE